MHVEDEGQSAINPLSTSAEAASAQSSQLDTSANQTSRQMSQSQESLPTSGSIGSQAAVPSTVTVDDTVWLRNLHQMTDNKDEHPQELHADTNSASSSSALSNSLPARKRVRFGGESLAHSLLPLMDGHAELSSGHDNQAYGNVDRTSLQEPTAPVSKQPRGKAPWINADCQAHLNLLSHLPVEDRYYLYNIKKVFRFPQKSVTTELVRVFFQVVCPLQPVMDRRVTTDLYLRLYTNQQSSPLLFHAMFFCASSYVDENTIQSAGFEDTAEAKLYFGSRARILYSYDCEPDHLFIVQALILLSFWWMDYTEEKDMRYWLSCAVNLATTMGMYKALPKTLTMSPIYHRLWRRVFWTLFVSGQTVSIQ
jgi:Fungal specific transcription factor domain